MSEERAKRKLSGILSADAVGYSRLMREDGAETIRTLPGDYCLCLNCASICWLQLKPVQNSPSSIYPR
jgi:hypothetical protein